MTGRAKTILKLLVLICFVLAAQTLRWTVAWRAPRIIEIEDVGLSEPSGIVFHAGRGTLFVVGDNGEISEITTNGAVLQARYIGSHDLEGITFNPSTGLLYAAVEGWDTVLEVDPEGLKIRRHFILPRTFEGKTILKPVGQGLESITFVPDAEHAEGGTFFVTNQGFADSDPEDASVLLRVELPLRTGAGAAQQPTPRILSCVRMDVTDLSGAHWDRRKRRLILISDAENRLVQVDDDGKVLASAPLPGRDQEGITFDNAGRMYIAQDSGGVLKIRGRIRWRPAF